MIRIIHLIVDYCLGSGELYQLRSASALSYQFIWWRAGFLDMVYEVSPRSLMLMRIHHDVSQRWDLLSVWICYVKVHNRRFGRCGKIHARSRHKIGVGGAWVCRRNFFKATLLWGTIRCIRRQTLTGRGANTSFDEKKARFFRSILFMLDPQFALPMVR